MADTQVWLEACNRQTDGHHFRRLMSPIPSVMGVMITIGVDRDLRWSGAASLILHRAAKTLRLSLDLAVLFTKKIL